nr:unnamed protein product [Digitaria exilis]
MRWETTNGKIAATTALFFLLMIYGVEARLCSVRSSTFKGRCSVAVATVAVAAVEVGVGEHNQGSQCLRSQQRQH